MSQANKPGRGSVADVLKPLATAAAGSEVAVEPHLVKPKVAWKLISCGNTRGYELLAAGKLESFLDGGSRKITMASIHRYIERGLAQDSALHRPAQATEVKCQ